MLIPLITIAIAAPLTPAQILLPEQPRSVLDYAITTETGSPTPIRLTFLRGDMSDPGTIFTNPNVDPNQLAVRRNVVYDIDGT
ncbi:MAG: hypothetical protein HN811_07680, partial [Phycisphaerae bacterium]|nr:hypothetical protein [Phycisphaerae bacterium]